MTITALTRSTVLHSVLIILAGCALHKNLHKAPVNSLEIRAGRNFLAAVEEHLPVWEKDSGFAQYERVEIATVKADVQMCVHANTAIEFLKWTDQLSVDWDKLVALDESLQKRYLM